jgi:hypothetical protein
MTPMGSRVLATMVTTTTYGTWLPGDLRGYVDRGVILPANPALLQHAKAMLLKDPVYFSRAERDVLFNTIQDAAGEFNYKLYCVSIECWHSHWLIWHGRGAADVMIGRLKTRMRQALTRGKVWTEGHCARSLYSEGAMDIRMRYIQAHEGHRFLPGELPWKPRLH